MHKNIYPQTIQIFLPTGDPTAIRIAEITTAVIRAIEVPRVLLSDFFKMDEAKQVALYCLVGESDMGQPQVYIGQTSNLEMRLKQHNKDKEFWNKALIFISITNNMTNTHAQYLESLAIERANDVGRYKLENGNIGSRPHTPAPLKAECGIFFEIIETLSTTLGFPFFKPLLDKGSDTTGTIYYCKKRGAQASGKDTPEGFIVRKGSEIATDTTENFELRNGYVRLRARLIQEGTIINESGKMIFSKDYRFNSPSAASAVVCGMATNGWKVWKDVNGKSLSENERE